MALTKMTMFIALTEMTMFLGIYRGSTVVFFKALSIARYGNMVIILHNVILLKKYYDLPFDAIYCHSTCRHIILE